uniref:Pyruvate carboxyltransferase domain-containing protein n=1 Tax=viral metagenome TaxID=1070528 RepID=A0A6C0JZU5_9ZZZZ
MQSLCSRIQSIISKSSYHCSLYKKLTPILFDVSLRDGIQCASPSDWPTSKKKDTLDHIIKNYHPQSIELGSLCSHKLLPIMSDTIELYNYAKTMCLRDNIDCNIYVLIPSIAKLQSAIDYNMTHLSFITSISNTFQVKNTNMTLSQVKSSFVKMSEYINCLPNSEVYVKKLYISCINECPISGKLDNDFVINEILTYNTMGSFDELCLSDTCGTLQYDELVYIVDTIHFFGVPLSKISLHLHVSENNLENLEHILRYCFRKGICKFDVSMIETGGCSITIKREKLLSNMTYEQFYNILDKHVNAVVENNSL